MMIAKSRKIRTSRSSLMGRLFVKRLLEGAIIDRNQTQRKWGKRQVVPVPQALRQRRAG